MATNTDHVANDALYDEININYEKAYGKNAMKIETTEKLVSFLIPFPPDTYVLDLGCGTGKPVSDILAKVGLRVTGCDVSSRMIELASTRVTGNFFVGDMTTFQPNHEFAAIFIMFSHLHMSYAELHATIQKYTASLSPGGFLVVGTVPSDTYVEDASQYDSTGTYVDGFMAPFMGKMLPTLLVTADGMRKLITSTGLEIVFERTCTFAPENGLSEPEEQQYIIAKRSSSL